MKAGVAFLIIFLALILGDRFMNAGILIPHSLNKDIRAGVDSLHPQNKIAVGPSIEMHAFGNTMPEMHYDVDEIHIKARKKITITLINDGTDFPMMHNIVIVKPEDADSVASHGLYAGAKRNFVPREKSVIAKSKMAKPGKTIKMRFTAPGKGEYLFMCTYPGHYKQMRGKVIVQ